MSRITTSIARTLETRRCEFARGMSGLVNYVTVETTDGQRYAAFFEVRRLKTVGLNAVQLMVQSRTSGGTESGNLPA